MKKPTIRQHKPSPAEAIAVVLALAALAAAVGMIIHDLNHPQSLFKQLINSQHHDQTNHPPHPTKATPSPTTAPA